MAKTRLTKMRESLSHETTCNENVYNKEGKACIEDLNTTKEEGNLPTPVPNERRIFDVVIFSFMRFIVLRSNSNGEVGQRSCCRCGACGVGCSRHFNARQNLGERKCWEYGYQRDCIPVATKG